MEDSAFKFRVTWPTKSEMPVKHVVFQWRRIVLVAWVFHHLAHILLDCTWIKAVSAMRGEEHRRHYTAAYTLDALDRRVAHYRRHCVFTLSQLNWELRRETATWPKRRSAQMSPQMSQI